MAGAGKGFDALGVNTAASAVEIGSESSPVAVVGAGGRCVLQESTLSVLSVHAMRMIQLTMRVICGGHAFSKQAPLPKTRDPNHGTDTSTLLSSSSNTYAFAAYRGSLQRNSDSTQHPRRAILATRRCKDPPIPRDPQNPLHSESCFGICPYNNMRYLEHEIPIDVVF